MSVSIEEDRCLPNANAWGVPPSQAVHWRLVFCACSVEFMSHWGLIDLEEPSVAVKLQVDHTHLKLPAEGLFGVT